MIEVQWARPITLGDLKPGDVFWQPAHGPGNLYMVCEPLPSYLQITNRHGDGEVLLVRVGGIDAPTVCMFSKDHLVEVVEVVLTVRE